MALPVALLFVVFALPRMRGSMMDAAADHDARARDRGGYMQEVCGEGMDLDRDELLCGCVLAVEYPGLDCMDRFREWLVDRQAERCADASVFDAAPGFCTCVQSVNDATAELVGDERKRERATAYERCEGLDDVLEPPDLETLLRSFGEAEAKRG